MNDLPRIILPVSYFPPVSYFICLASGHPVLIETGETYPKQTFRNRCAIAGAQGRQILVVPVSKPFGNHTKTYGVMASRHVDWRKKHWRAIETAYSSSPYFLYYGDAIHALLEECTDNLAELNMKILAGMLDMAGTKVEVMTSRDYLKSPEHSLDLRTAFSKKGFSASHELKPYGQVFSQLHGFIRGLSILDLLFNLGPETHGYLADHKGLIPGFYVSA